jgi:recombination protein RecT
MPQRETVSQAVERQGGDQQQRSGGGPKSALARKAMEQTAATMMVADFAGSFGRVLPPHVPQESFVALTRSMLLRDAKLHTAANRSPATLLMALMDCAALGHVPGHGYALTTRTITPREGEPFPVVLGIEEYTGKIQRMYRGGMVRGIECEVVRKNDRYQRPRSVFEAPVHEFDPFDSFESRGPIRGVYTYAALADTSRTRVVHLNNEQIAAHEDKAEMKTIWRHPIFRQDMVLKTALHVLTKFLPLSSDYLKWQGVVEVRRQEEEEKLPESPIRYNPNADADPGETIIVDPDVDIIDDEESLRGEPHQEQQRGGDRR